MNKVSKYWSNNKSKKKQIRAEINLSAIYTKICRFKDAKIHAENAINLIESQPEQSSNKEMIENSIVAYYNIGAAQEALKKYQQS